jgi:hypothetical protein
MPTKKSAPQKSQAANSGMGDVWKWVYVVGLVIAGLVGAFKFTAAEPFLGWLLLLAGILVAIFFFDSEDIVNFAIRFLLLFAVSKAFEAIPAVGPYLSGFFQGVVGFLTPVGLTLLIVYFWKKYFGSMM